MVLGISVDKQSLDWVSDGNVVKANVGRELGVSQLDLPNGSHTLHFYSDSAIGRDVSISVGKEAFRVNNLSKQTEATVNVNISLGRVFSTGVKDRLNYLGRRFTAKGSEYKDKIKGASKDDAKTFAVDHKYPLLVIAAASGLVTAWFAFQSSRSGRAYIS